MTYSAHQISFLPWIGFWKKIYDSDYFDLSIYDQFTESTWIHFTYIGNKEKRYKWKLPVEKEFLNNTRYHLAKGYSLGWRTLLYYIENYSEMSGRAINAGIRVLVTLSSDVNLVKTDIKTLSS